MKLALIRLIAAIAAASIMTWILAAVNYAALIDRSFTSRHLVICILLIILAAVAYLAVPLSIIGVILALQSEPGDRQKGDKMKTETSMLLEHFGRYCMWHLPHLESYVTEAQKSGDVRTLLTYMEPWSRVDKVREAAAEIRRLEGIK